jgi:hypothetical protein
MSLRFEQALDAARETEGRAKILVTISVNRNNGMINCFTGTLHYTNKKQEEFICEETLATAAGKPLQNCSVHSALASDDKNDHLLPGDTISEIEFSITNNLVESRMGLFKAIKGENDTHKIKFEERGDFLIGIEAPVSNEPGEIIYTISFNEVIEIPAANTLAHF